MENMGHSEIENSVLNALSESVFIFSSSKNAVSYWNDSFEKLTDLNKKKILGKKDLDGFFGPGDFKTILKTIKEQGFENVATLKISLMEKFQSSIPVECRISKIKAEDNSPQILLIMRDLRPEIKAQENLNFTRFRYEQVINNMSEFIVHWKKDGVRTFVNKSYCQYYRTTEEQAIGTSFFPLITKEDLNIVQSRIKRLTPENPESEGEHRVIRANGTIGWNYWRDKAIYNDGIFLEYHSIGRDITEKKLAEEKLLQSEKLEVMGQLAGGIAHDFNNQLSGFQAYAELIKIKGAGNEDTKAYADKILTLVQRSKDLTRQLLAFSRKEGTENQVFDIHIIIHEVISILERSIDKQILLESNLNAKFAYVSGNTSLLQNIFLNIALNARDAIKEKGSIIFSTENLKIKSDDIIAQKFGIAEGPYVCIILKDTGMGMDQKTQDKIFQPFFTTKESGKGTGMGLASVFNTLKNHHGAIDVISELNKGSEFKLYFPLAQPPKIKKIVPEKSPIKKFKANILFVDDEEMLATSVDLILSSFGFKVFTAKSGREAVLFFEENRKNVDLVLLDMNMPEMSGKDTYTQLKKIDPSIKVIMLSGYSRAEAAGGQELETLGFIQKPVTEETLIQEISKSLQL